MCLTLLRSLDLRDCAPNVVCWPMRCRVRLVTQIRLEHMSSGTAVAAWTGRYRGLLVRPEQIVVVAGVAQALVLLARVLPSMGYDRLGVEDPGSFGARRYVEAWGMPTASIPVDEHGLQVDALIASAAPAVLVTPAHQFPSGVVLEGGRRRDLIQWASEGGLILGDDYDAEHRYDRAPVKALHPMLPDRVCYMGSLSKILAPALRVGWLIVPGWMRTPMVEAKRDTDLGNPALAQLVLADLMNSGDLSATYGSPVVGTARGGTRWWGLCGHTGRAPSCKERRQVCALRSRSTARQIRM